MLLDPITIKVTVSKSKVRLEKLVGAVSHQGERKTAWREQRVSRARQHWQQRGGGCSAPVGAAHRTCFTRCWWQSRSLPATAEQPI